jgi:ribonuclease-3
MIDIASLFTDPAKLEPALIHRSYINENPNHQSNERLEFLGDAVLSLIISVRLYRLFPDTPEGELTARRSALVQTSSLATQSQILGFDKLLKLSRGEEDGGGRQNPSLLANTFEAVLGALYLDGGLEVCTEFITQVFPDSHITSLTQLKDPKSLLQELSQSKGWGTPTYQVISTTGPDHSKKFEVSVKIADFPQISGSGTSKQRAETAAATSALSHFSR